MGMRRGTPQTRARKSSGGASACSGLGAATLGVHPMSPVITHGGSRSLLHVSTPSNTRVGAVRPCIHAPMHGPRRTPSRGRVGAALGHDGPPAPLVRRCQQRKPQHHRSDRSRPSDACHACTRARVRASHAIHCASAARVAHMHCAATYLLAVCGPAWRFLMPPRPQNCTSPRTVIDYLRFCSIAVPAHLRGRRPATVKSNRRSAMRTRQGEITARTAPTQRRAHVRRSE